MSDSDPAAAVPEAQDGREAIVSPEVEQVAVRACFDYMRAHPSEPFGYPLGAALAAVAPLLRPSAAVREGERERSLAILESHRLDPNRCCDCGRQFAAQYQHSEHLADLLAAPSLAAPEGTEQ